MLRGLFLDRGHSEGNISAREVIRASLQHFSEAGFLILAIYNKVATFPSSNVGISIIYMCSKGSVLD